MGCLLDMFKKSVDVDPEESTWDIYVKDSGAELTRRRWYQGGAVLLSLLDQIQRDVPCAVVVTYKDRKYLGVYSPDEPQHSEFMRYVTDFIQTHGPFHKFDDSFGPNDLILKNLKSKLKELLKS